MYRVLLYRLVFAFMFFTFFIGCGIFDSDEGKENICDKVASSGMPPIKLSGDGVVYYQKSISNITYDSLGRVKYYNYTLSSGGESYSGYVDYESGIIEINGKKCSLNKSSYYKTNKNSMKYRVVIMGKKCKCRLN